MRTFSVKKHCKFLSQIHLFVDQGALDQLVGATGNFVLIEILILIPIFYGAGRSVGSKWLAHLSSFKHSEPKVRVWAF